MRQFSPQLVLVSAGFDAHQRDPLASMRLTTEGYASVVSRVMTAAGGAPIAFVTEGGYDLGALAECLDASFAVIAGAASTSDSAAADELRKAPAVRGERALNVVREAQSRFWRGI
jgi:acetoin utilization deacetylase AcuC-like enzyme